MYFKLVYLRYLLIGDNKLIMIDNEGRSELHERVINNFLIENQNACKFSWLQ